MPDYPYPYALNPTRPIGPGGARLRFYRRRAGAGEERATETRQGEGGDIARWRELLSASVAELNESLQGSGTPLRCALEEDERGISLRIFHLEEDGSLSPSEGPADEVEEYLEPADLPRWLARLRAGLGIVVDERA